MLNTLDLSLVFLTVDLTKKSKKWKVWEGALLYTYNEGVLPSILIPASRAYAAPSGWN